MHKMQVYIPLFSFFAISLAAPNSLLYPEIQETTPSSDNDEVTNEPTLPPTCPSTNEPPTTVISDSKQDIDITTLITVAENIHNLETEILIPSQGEQKTSSFWDGLGTGIKNIFYKSKQTVKGVASAVKNTAQDIAKSAVHKVEDVAQSIGKVFKK